MHVCFSKRDEDFQGSHVYSVSVIYGNKIINENRLEGLVYSPEKVIDGYYLVIRTERECSRQIEEEHDVVIGVSSHPERRNEKVRECARTYAQEIAKYLDCKVEKE